MKRTLLQAILAAAFVPLLQADSFTITLTATEAFSLGEPGQPLVDMEAILTTDGTCDPCTISGATASGGEPSTVVSDGITGFALSPTPLFEAHIYLYNFFSDFTDGQTWGNLEFDRSSDTLTAALGNWGSDLTWIFPDGTWHNDGDGSRDTFGVYSISGAGLGDATPISVSEVPEPATIWLLGAALLSLAACGRKIFCK